MLKYTCNQYENLKKLFVSLQLMKKMDFFNQPYPFELPSWKYSLKLAFAIGGFIALFLLIFQPFGLEEIPSSYKPWMISVYGGITFIAILVFQQGIMRAFPNFFREQDWTTGKEIVENLSILLLIAIGNFYYTYWIGGIRPTLIGFLFLFFATVLVGIFPVATLIFVHYTNSLRRNLREAQALDVSLQSKSREKPTTQVTISSQYKEDNLSLAPEQLLWISAADNYVEVNYVVNSKHHKKLIRNSLSNLEKECYPHGILRTHRSYLANIHKAIHIQGNAQGYRLKVEDSIETVPLSRKYAPAITEWMNRKLDIRP